MIRLGVSTAMLATGATLLIAAALVTRSTAADQPARAAVLRIAATRDIDSLDPATSSPIGINGNSAWPILQATCARLLNFPDSGKGRAPYPEVAAGFPDISRDGRTYWFTLRRGFRFNDGTPVRAANFAREITRFDDPNVSDVHASRYRLRITLKAPQGDFVTQLATPWYCPVPTNFPVPGSTGVDLVSGGGPYYAIRDVNRRIVLRPNTHYHGKRPHRVREIVETIGGDEVSNAQVVLAGQADYSPDNLPPDDARILSQTPQGRRQIVTVPSLSTFYVAFNTSRPLFRGNLALRRAINFALDRRALAQSPFGRVGTLTDQILPPGMPGYRNLPLYPLRAPNLRKARALAKGHLRGHHAVLYTWNSPYFLARSQTIKTELARIGLQVQVEAFPYDVFLDKVGTRDEPYDMSNVNWVADYPDPAGFMAMFDGRTIRATENRSNFSRLNIPRLNMQIGAAGRMPAPSRYRAFARLDAEIMRKYVPVAATNNGIEYHAVASRIGCFVIIPGIAVDYAAMCLH